MMIMKTAKRLAVFTLALVMIGCGAATSTVAPPTTSAPPIQTVSVLTPLPPTPAPALTASTEPAAMPATLTQASPPTPACGDNMQITPAQTEGPFYKPDTPERTALIERGATGTKLNISGYVLTRDCRPIAGAVLDFWQADDRGEYDNTGYNLRGHQVTDAAGRYHLATIVPGLYPGRTRHIHVKVQAPNQPVLTTQLYFPGETQNTSDSIYNPALLMKVQDTSNGEVATFNFVLDVK